MVHNSAYEPIMIHTTADRNGIVSEVDFIKIDSLSSIESFCLFDYYKSTISPLQHATLQITPVILGLQAHFCIIYILCAIDSKSTIIVDDEP